MIVWNGYWVEEYVDTVNSSVKLLLVLENQVKIIKDQLDVGLLQPGEEIAYGNVELNEKEDREIVAIYMQDDSLYHTNIIRAWRANIEKGRFEDFSPQGIRVKNAQLYYR